MGLDGVQLVMGIEEEFSIEISDQGAERIGTVGDLFNLVRTSLHLKMRPAPSDPEIWLRVQKTVVEQLGVKPEQVTREARFIEDLGVTAWTKEMARGCVNHTPPALSCPKSGTQLETCLSEDFNGNTSNFKLLT